MIIHICRARLGERPLTRFMETNHDTLHGELPLGSRVAVMEHGEHAPAPIPGRT